MTSYIINTKVIYTNIKEANEVRLLPSKNEVLLSLGGVLGCAGEAASPHVRSKVPKMMNVYFVMFSIWTKPNKTNDQQREILQLGAMQGRNLRLWSNCVQPSSHSHSYIKVVFDDALHCPLPHSTSLHMLSVFFSHNNWNNPTLNESH